MRFQPGDTVGPYRVTGLIGEGSTGVVYQVVNSVTGRLEAVKVLADSFMGNREQAQRFLREIQLQAHLDHPNIAQVRTAFCEGNTIVLVMELVDGERLSAILRRGPLSVAGAVRVAEQVLGALIMAHHHGVVHRDVKPANILLDRVGNAKLTDFGLAKRYGDPGQTSQGLAVGTVFYMSPEQVRGLPDIDWRADLYAVGVLLYEMLTGRRPFDGAEQYAVMRAHIELLPVPVRQWAPHLPKEWDALLDRALQKDPAMRFQSAAGFLTALQEIPTVSAPPRRFNWNYVTYAAGMGTLALAAFAVPPTVFEPRLETLELQMPAAPAAPEWAFRVPEPVVTPAPEPAPTVPLPVRRATPAPRVVRQPDPVPFSATKIHNAEAPTPAPEPVAAVPARPAPVELPPPSVAPAEPAPVAAPPLPEQPAVAAPGEKQPNWMRRNLGKFPRLFRRRNAENAPKE
jgi:serine/threonine-protein kinase